MIDLAERLEKLALDMPDGTLDLRLEARAIAAEVRELEAALREIRDAQAGEASPGVGRRLSAGRSGLRGYWDDVECRDCGGTGRASK
jgi:hypothetical protein